MLRLRGRTSLSELRAIVPNVVARVARARSQPWLARGDIRGRLFCVCKRPIWRESGQGREGNRAFQCVPASGRNPCADRNTQAVAAIRPAFLTAGCRGSDGEGRATRKTAVRGLGAGEHAGRLRGAPHSPASLPSTVPSYLGGSTPLPMRERIAPAVSPSPRPGG